MVPNGRSSLKDLQQALRNPVVRHYAAFRLQAADPSRHRFCELQPDTDAAAVFGNEDGTKLFQNRLKRIDHIRCGLVQLALEVLDDDLVDPRAGRKLTP